MGFCTEQQSQRFLEVAPGVEKAMVDSGIPLLKYWLEVGEEGRPGASRPHRRPRKVWKLSDMRTCGRMVAGTTTPAAATTYQYTDTAWAPWYVVYTDDKRRGAST